MPFEPVLLGKLMRPAAAALSLWLMAVPALAQEEETLSVAEATELLQSRQAADIQRGLESLGLSGARGGVAPIAARIEQGLPPQLLQMAIDTLSILGRREAGPILTRLMSHRRADVRLAAVRAIAATQPRNAEEVLTGGLSDLAPEVRGAAAEGLGTIGATGALDALFAAMERQVPEAPMAIGQLATPAAVDRFLGYLGRVSLDVLGPALSEMLSRQDLASSARVSIVHRISEFATPGARQILQDFVDSSGESSGGAARRAAIDAMPRMGN